MADGDDRQATFGSDGSLETDTTPDATGENDFGEPKESNETDGGYSRYTVSSLLQKAVRRSDEEVAAWAAWELARSGYAWNLWDRLNLYVVEDLRAGSDVALTIERYEELATERWEPAEWKGRLCAIHAALAAARATSTREASNADAYFSAVADRRAAARERGEDPAHDFPVGDLEPGGTFDAIFDGHTGEGSRLGRGTRFFKTHGARVGPEGEDEQSARWQRLAMLLDEDRDYDPDELDRAVEPVDPDDPWGEHGPDGRGDGSDEPDDRDKPDDRDDDAGDRGSLSDFSG
ncbi:hypothetical protein C461_07179 [Halorubrum aidingense JCM 13560]|uniref:Uncharacterized protein n=1 Tax=Halorubrum aidingense JCM 13560 TaxID=1230454 RepID=M0PFF5_9EURY|nr:hypothetical protein [Halorubrum aidingense]EMA67490.1 hypothetical protein C461_07179 [Halorubrum aidingense JCM 13560]